MDDLALLREYLVRQRMARLHLGHTKALLATAESFADIKALAHEAETLHKVLVALDLLVKNRDEFSRSYLT